MAETEADTCRKFVVPKLQEAGWDDPPHAINEQRTFTDGRIVFVGGKARRGKQKRADYVLRYRQDFPIAVVEAKARYKDAAEGLQQARDYAEILGLKFAYATNGVEIIEVDYTNGVEAVTFRHPRNSAMGLRTVPSHRAQMYVSASRRSRIASTSSVRSPWTRSMARSPSNCG